MKSQTMFQRFAFAVTVATLALLAPVANAQFDLTVVPDDIHCTYEDADGVGTLHLLAAGPIKPGGVQPLWVTLDQNGNSFSGWGERTILQDRFVVNLIVQGRYDSYHFWGDIYRGSYVGQGWYTDGWSTYWWKTRR